MDKETFARQVTQMRTAMYRVAASYLRGEADRLDAVSEAIAKGWEKRGTLRDERLFATRMTRILIRECINIQRRQRRMTPVDTLPEQATEEMEPSGLEEAIDRLPQRQRTMVVLHYVEGYDVREIAAMMTTTKSAVCAGLSRARKRLRSLIGEEWT